MRLLSKQEAQYMYMPVVFPVHSQQECSYDDQLHWPFNIPDEKGNVSDNKSCSSHQTFSANGMNGWTRDSPPIA